MAGQQPPAASLDKDRRSIELGDATGPTSRPSLSGTDFLWCADRWYWQGDTGCAERGKATLMAEMAKPDPWGFLVGGHYDWERTYRPLRQMLASGILSDGERKTVEEKLLAIALTSTDWAGLVPLQQPVGSATDWMTRHPISGLIAHFILYDYLAHVADVPADKREAVAKGYELLRQHIESLIDLVPVIARKRHALGEHAAPGRHRVAGHARQALRQLRLPWPRHLLSPIGAGELPVGPQRATALGQGQHPSVTGVAVPAKGVAVVTREELQAPQLEEAGAQVMLYPAQTLQAVDAFPGVVVSRPGLDVGERGDGDLAADRSHR